MTEICYVETPWYLIVFHNCTKTVSIGDDPYWTSKKNSLELIELSSINKVSLV